MSLKHKLIAQIAQTGPMSVAQYMASCLYDPQHGYYATRPAIGGGNADFITAPEASQMFGELIGLWCVHEWDAMQRPALLNWIELGPGSGALASDAWRAARIVPAYREAAQLSLIELSPVLRLQQATALQRVGGKAQWADKLDAVATGASLIVANEFFDCLPIRQFVRGAFGLQVEGRPPLSWRERLIGASGDALTWGLSGHAFADAFAIPPALHDAPEGTIAEHAPALAGWVDAIAQRLHAAPGRALIVDYASDGAGDTLQAVRRHRKIGPLEAPGESDLTARVDYTSLKILARASGLDVAGPVAQGDFLKALGIEARAQALAQTHPERAERIQRELARLTDSAQMGALFKVLCLSTPDLPPPAGF